MSDLDVTTRYILVTVPACDANELDDILDSMSLDPAPAGTSARTLSDLSTLCPERPTAIYVPPVTETDDTDAEPAMIRCPVCSGTDVYEVDRAVRWTEVEYGQDDDPARVTVRYGDSTDYESDHLRCADEACAAELSYPANWSTILREDF